MLSNANERYLVYNGKEFERKSQLAEKSTEKKHTPDLSLENETTLNNIF